MKLIIVLSIVVSACLYFVIHFNTPTANAQTELCSPLKCCTAVTIVHKPRGCSNTCLPWESSCKPCTHGQFNCSETTNYTCLASTDKQSSSYGVCQTQVAINKCLRGAKSFPDPVGCYGSIKQCSPHHTYCGGCINDCKDTSALNCDDWINLICSTVPR